MISKKYFWALRAITWKARGRSIGLPSYIGPPLYVGGEKNIHIGKRVRIWPNLRIEALNGAVIVIEDDVVIGQNCHITAGVDLFIRRGCVFIGHNVITNIHHSALEHDIHPCERSMTTEMLDLGERLLVGFGAVILPGSGIAAGSTVGANAVVSRLQCNQASVIAGIPARVIKELID